MNTHLIGNDGEDMAVGFLKKEGHTILERNYRFRDGEIDIISLEKQKDDPFGIDEYVVFTEVKYRKDKAHGNPYDAVDLNKQRKISRIASKFLYDNRYPTDTAVRFDVISISGDEIEWFKNAFEYKG